MNYNAGVKTPVSNIVMSLMVMIVLVALTGLFHDLPNCILASIIINAVIGLIDFSAMYKIWKVDFGDFIAMAGAFLGVVFISVEIGLLIAVRTKNLHHTKSILSFLLLSTYDSLIYPFEICLE